MAAVAQVHAQDGVAGLEQGQVHRHIGLGAGVGLHIGMLRAKEFDGPLNGQVLDLVHILAAAIVSGAGIALGVFIGQMAAHGLHHRGGHKVLGSDQLNMVLLTGQLTHHGGIDFRVLPPYLFIAHWYFLRFSDNRLVYYITVSLFSQSADSDQRCLRKNDFNGKIR